MKVLFKDGDYILEPYTSGEQDELSELVGCHVSISKEDFVMLPLESLRIWNRLDDDGRKRLKDAYYKLHHLFQRLEKRPPR